MMALYILLFMLVVGVLLFCFGKTQKTKELAGFFTVGAVFYGLLIGICLV